MSKTLSYWKERNAKSQDKLSQKNIKEIEKQTLEYYRLAYNNTVKDFEKVFIKLLETAEVGREFTPADLYKLEGYWEAQVKLKKILEKLGTKQIELYEKKFILEWNEIYRVFDLENHFNFGELDTKKTKQLINHIWCADGKSWSERVWGNTEKLQQALNDSLLDCVVRGKKTTELKNLLQKDFAVDYHRADTLVRTEIAHIQTEAAQQRFKDAGIKKVRVWADKDERRCDVCGGFHEKVFFIGETANLPPYHPNCRCCIIPVIED